MNTFKLVQWAYKMGVHQERLRIKNIITEYHATEKPERPRPEAHKLVHQEFQDRINLYYAVGDTLNQLLEPKIGRGTSDLEPDL